jgi:hypothetical protein
VQLALEEDLGSRVLQGKAELFKALWQQAQLISSTVLALVADARTNYVGQMQRLEQLAEKDGDEGESPHCNCWAPTWGCG